MFEKLDYKKWCIDNKIHELFNIDLAQYGDIEKKFSHTTYGSVDPNNNVPFEPELDDLIRLHYLVRSRKVTTVLEFGVGRSSIAFADAIKKNKEEFGSYVAENLRRANPFEVHSIDNYEEYIQTCKNFFPKQYLEYVTFHFSKVTMGKFNDRACTYYDKLPNICPDFIYLDAPDQFNTHGDINGISTATADRLPMAADLLMMEPFFLPGTLIVVDGRTANARFLKNNFQREWKYAHLYKEDIHVFELNEAPLGMFNERQLRFCLGWEPTKTNYSILAGVKS